jgi:hypothetical protein
MEYVFIWLRAPDMSDQLEAPVARVAKRPLYANQLTKTNVMFKSIDS